MKSSFDFILSHLYSFYIFVCLMFSWRISANIMYSIMDSGQPCLTPRSKRNNLDRCLLLWPVLLCCFILPWFFVFYVHSQSAARSLTGSPNWLCQRLSPGLRLSLLPEYLLRLHRSLFSWRFSMIVLPLIAAVCSRPIMSLKVGCILLVTILLFILLS